MGGIAINRWNWKFQNRCCCFSAFLNSIFLKRFCWYWDHLMLLCVLIRFRLCLLPISVRKHWLRKFVWRHMSRDSLMIAYLPVTCITRNKRFIRLRCAFHKSICDHLKCANIARIRTHKRKLNKNWGWLCKMNSIGL